MLELRGISTGYGAVQALHDVSLTVQAGEIVTLIGANGAGKSTTLMTICGVVPPRRGEILFEERPIHRLGAERIVELGVSQVPEGRRIFAQMSVLENLEMGAFRRRDREGVRADLDYVFGLFPILARRRHQAGGTLSGGEQQMLAISRALLARPRLLLLDEPSLGLAPLVIRQIFSILRQINREHGTTILLVEQNANQALRLAHRGYVLESGRIVLADTAENLLASDEVKKAYLGV
jgi:branched-chain amino acid transport system ATP-binding protein